MPDQACEFTRLAEDRCLSPPLAVNPEPARNKEDMARQAVREPRMPSAQAVRNHSEEREPEDEEPSRSC